MTQRLVVRRGLHRSVACRFLMRIAANKTESGQVDTAVWIEWLVRPLAKLVGLLETHIRLETNCDPVSHAVWRMGLKHVLMLSAGNGVEEQRSTKTKSKFAHSRRPLADFSVRQRKLTATARTVSCVSRAVGGPAAGNPDLMDGL